MVETVKKRRKYRPTSGSTIPIWEMVDRQIKASLKKDPYATVKMAKVSRPGKSKVKKYKEEKDESPEMGYLDKLLKPRPTLTKKQGTGMSQGGIVKRKKKPKGWGKARY
tara:strand:+ start:257 stop:583 length:327 start_codon:yes stop_codon:yes gene_type:complete